MFPNTLYYFQTTGPRQAAGLELMERKLELLESMGHLTAERLTAKGEFASWLYGYELLLSELHEQQRLRDLDPLTLAVLMVGIVYEPRPGLSPPKAHRLSKRLAQLCREPLERIHAAEKTFRIGERSKAPSFVLSHAMEAWMHKAPFEQVARLVDVDEGEVVRYFRMAVQLLRQLIEAPAGDPALRTNAQKALERINRDLIDAEAQLRMGAGT